MSPPSLPSVADFQPSAGLTEKPCHQRFEKFSLYIPAHWAKDRPWMPSQWRGLGLWREHASPSTFWSAEQFRRPFKVGYLFFCENRRWESSQKEADCPRRTWCSDLLRLLPDSPCALPVCRHLARPFSNTTEKKLQKGGEHR